jgi:molecular chaperone GrpE
MDSHDPQKEQKQDAKHLHEQGQPEPAAKPNTDSTGASGQPGGEATTSTTAAPESAEKTDYRALIDEMSDEELAALFKRVSEATLYLEALQRATADYDNYQKRVEKERDSTYKYAIQNVIRELLRTADIFAIAIQSAASQTKDKDYKNFYDGMCLVQEDLHKTFRQFGVQQIEAKNRKFDPRYHEAVRQVETQDHPDMTVLEEIEKGYMLNERLLRPSKVIVGRKPQPPAQTEGNKTNPPETQTKQG